MLSWFDANDATGVGVALAEDVASSFTVKMRQLDHSGSPQDSKDLRRFLTKVKHDAGSLRLNLYKKAKLASSFKTKLLDNGVDSALAEHLTQLVLTQLAGEQLAAASPEPATPVRHKRPDFRKAQELLSEACEFSRGGQHRKAADAFQELVQLSPGNAEGLAGLGAAQWHLGAYAEAEKHFRRAIDVQPGHLDALCNLGIVLHARGEYLEAEKILRRAIKSKPAFLRAQCALASVLIMQARVGEAESLLAKVLRSAPRDADALVCMARVMRLNGRFDEERTLLMRALESNRRLPSAWAGLVGIRRMTPADSDWLRGAEEVLTGVLEPREESELRFAVGKYWDDVGQYDKAFKSYQRANLLARKLAPKYDLHARETEVRDLIRGYSPQNVRNVSAAFAAASPVFVVGMMRSGTTLVEQILATHPRAAGAGELAFWAEAYSRNEAAIRSGQLSEAVRRQLGERYLQLLRSYGADSKVVIDKTNINADYLGLIHTVFPAARFICVERNPIDTCLSCYFQSLSPTHSYAFDLAELAHYYRLHRQLMRHWKSVLPSGVMLQVSYEQLVSHKEKWIRKILDFAGLDWQPQCLNFNQTVRPVVTASAWQVRQSMYSSSVGRWRYYEKHVGPLSSLTRST
jgi:tetratricopeptide (TPR) repeat protein